MCDDGNPTTYWQTNVSDAIAIAGIFGYDDWGDYIFDFTFQLIHEGWFDYVDPGLATQTWLYATAVPERHECDESAVVKAYWQLRGMHGIVGARCSGSSRSIARISSLENVPQVSPSSTSSTLSDKEEFPDFSRLVAPDDGHGEVGAVVAMLRSFGWKRVSILSTNNQFSQDWTTEFRGLWIEEEDDDASERWNGVVVHSNTLRLTQDGSLDVDFARQALEAVPAEDSPNNSRIILLVAHDGAAFELLKLADSMNFQPGFGTIWVGPSAWTGKIIPDDLAMGKISNFPGYGYLGVTPLRYKGQRQSDFLQLLQTWQAQKNRASWGGDKFPTFAAETVDSILAMTTALLRTPKEKRNDGFSVVRELRNLEFEGMSGPVSFTENGDREDPKFAIIQGAYGNDTWVEIGATGVDGVSSFIDLKLACFPGLTCGVIPKDSNPLPKDKLEGWVLGTIIPIAILLLGLAAKYWASTRSKRKIKAELKAFRDSVVATRAVKQMYIPWTSSELSGDNPVMNSETVSSLPPSPPPPQVEWHWQETPFKMNLHLACDVADYHGCWVKYSSESNAKLETAYQQSKKLCSPLKGYSVNFETMEQKNESTGFPRAVRRIVDVASDATNPADDVCTSGSTCDIDYSAARYGTRLPKEICNEPQMVLLPGDIVQVSNNRPDGLAFGTKLFSANEDLEREILASLSSKSSEEEVACVTANSGWFELDATRVPSSDDLKPLKANVGDTAVLDPPDTWETVVNPTVAQLHEIKTTDTEYNGLANAFLSTLSRDRVKILKIQRVQNLAMWQSYVVKRQTICYRDNADPTDKRALGRVEKRWLYHGTNVEILDKILQQGFNRSFCGKNATVYGKGVYFARDASYSVNRTYAVPDRQGNQYIMACRVVVGEYCVGKLNAITPDVRDAKTHTLFDSTVDLLTNPSIFVTYHDAQAYPEYIIKFKQI